MERMSPHSSAHSRGGREPATKESSETDVTRDVGYKSSFAYNLLSFMTGIQAPSHHVTVKTWPLVSLPTQTTAQHSGQVRGFSLWELKCQSPCLVSVQSTHTSCNFHHTAYSYMLFPQVIQWHCRWSGCMETKGSWFLKCFQRGRKHFLRVSEIPISRLHIKDFANTSLLICRNKEATFPSLFWSLYSLTSWVAYINTVFLMSQHLSHSHETMTIVKLSLQITDNKSFLTSTQTAKKLLELNPVWILDVIPRTWTLQLPDGPFLLEVWHWQELKIQEIEIKCHQQMIAFILTAIATLCICLYHCCVLNMLTYSKLIQTLK